MNAMLSSQSDAARFAPASRSSWTTVSAWFAGLACLQGMLLTGCAMPGSMQASSDHVYSAQSPGGMNEHVGAVAWPDEEFSASPAAASVPVSRADYGDGITQHRDASEAGVQQVVGRETEPEPADINSIVDPKVMRVSYETGAALNGRVATTHPLATFAEAEPRVCDPAQSEYGIPAETVGAALVDTYPEEYIFDGGDRGEPVHYYGGSMKGLETEDTVVEYRNHDGRNQVRPSNRVAVYAPRFGSVRAVSGPHNDIKVDKVVGAVEVSGVGNLLASNGHAESIEHTLVEGVQARHRADGVETDIIPHSSEQADSAHQNAKFDARHESRHYSAANSLQARFTAKQRQQLQNAIVWTRETFPQVSAATSQSTQIRATFKAQETIGLEDQRKEGPLRIIKLADKETAQAGEIITFTIHYQNLSDFEVTDVRIIDNLTPRLAYVDDSAQADLPGETIVEPNGEGSHRLIFEFDEPLPGRAYGTIIFSARVR
ncbi:MAG: hypothetical protein R3C19_17530 [Planctomycetaceae bacterium]